ncbi:ankyrin [Ramaria rubella]|nr:ankyrin [Ramaria rubella]
MSATPSERFKDAAAYMSNQTSPGLSKMPNDVKLELYALFKCITISKNPSTPRPSLFDFTGRAKWDAWDKLGNQSDQAEPDLWERRYLEIAHSFGWQESLRHYPIDDDQTTNRDGGAISRGGGGMGVRVSAIPQPLQDPKDQGTLHDLALSNDVQGLLSFLETHPESSVNSLDDYGYTSLHLAADRGNTDVVKALLDGGADVTIQDPDEFTALDLADIGGHNDIVEMIRAINTS